LIRFISNEKNKAKGITQLSGHIKKLEFECFYFDDFQAKKIKRAAIEIYPIIVHTNPAYTVADVNDYLEYKLKNNLVTSLNVMPLVLINLETIYLLFSELKADKLNLLKLFKLFFRIKKNRISRFNKEPNGINYLRAYASFEDVLRSKGLLDNEKVKRTSIREMFDLFNIEELFKEVA
jgi:hypothetical protein